MHVASCAFFLVLDAQFSGNVFDLSPALRLRERLRPQPRAAAPAEAPARLAATLAAGCAGGCTARCGWSLHTPCRLTASELRVEKLPANGRLVPLNNQAQAQIQRVIDCDQTTMASEHNAAKASGRRPGCPRRRRQVLRIDAQAHALVHAGLGLHDLAELGLGRRQNGLDELLVDLAAPNLDFRFEQR